MKTYYNTTYIGVIDLDTNEKQTRIVELEELDLSDWRKSFITELVKVAVINLDEFLAKSVAALATLLEPSFTGPKKWARQKTSKSSFGDLLLFWSYCLHRCVCVFVCVCVFGLLQASTLYSFRGEPATKGDARWKLYFQVRCPVYYIYTYEQINTRHTPRTDCAPSHPGSSQR